jgi:threonine synthase
MRRQGLIHRYREYLPVPVEAEVISLSEGSTPLILARNLSERVHPRVELWLKYDGLNPTGSFKDRGMTVAVTVTRHRGHKAILCASTGNTSASAAAYAARAGLQCIVLIPRGKISKGKLSQAVMHGARVLQIEGNFDRALELVREIAEQHPVAIVNSINPLRLEGQKTGAFEIIEDFAGFAPDFHAIPVGNAGNICAYWMGYREFHRNKLARNLPRMLGFQAEGAAPIVLGKPVEDPRTFATAIRIGNPASWEKALKARDESNGVIGMVSDSQIRRAWRSLAAAEGLFVEPASAASVAGVFKLAQNGFFDKVEPVEGDRIRVVCVLTGHGLKDPANAIKYSDEAVSVEANAEAILEAMQLYEGSSA